MTALLAVLIVSAQHSSKNGPPVVVYLHDKGHKYPQTTPELIVKFFEERSKK